MGSCVNASDNAIVILSTKSNCQFDDLVREFLKTPISDIFMLLSKAPIANTHIINNKLKKGKHMKSFLFLSVILLLFFSSGCVNPVSIGEERNNLQFAKEINQSQSYYDNLVVFDPENATAWVLRGNYYNDAFNQYETALQSYNKAIEIDPKNGYAWYSKGITLQNMHRLNESEVCFEKAKQYGIE